MWIHRPAFNAWCLYSGGRLEISIPTETLDTLCAETRWSRREALAWVESRPQGPPPVA